MYNLATRTGPFASPLVAAMAEVPKKPVGGAFGQWQKMAKATDMRCGLKFIDFWKTMSPGEKAPWEKQFQNALHAYNLWKASDSFMKPEGVKQGDGRKTKDKEAPKKPVGGAYGIYFNENRVEITKEAPGLGYEGFGAAAKVASSRWKAMSEADKQLYQDKFLAKQKEYKSAMASYGSKKVAEAQKAKAEATLAKVKASLKPMAKKAEKAAPKPKAKKAAPKPKAKKAAPKPKAKKAVPAFAMKCDAATQEASTPSPQKRKIKEETQTTTPEKIHEPPITGAAMPSLVTAGKAAPKCKSEALIGTDADTSCGAS